MYYIPLHYIPFRYIQMHWIPLHSIPFFYTTLHYIHTNTHLHTHTHTHFHIHIYTYTHTHTHNAHNLIHTANISRHCKCHSCLCACFDSIMSITQSDHVTTQQTCGELKTWMARKKLQKLRTKLCFLIHICWNCCADVPLIQLLCDVSFLCKLEQTIRLQNPIPAWKNIPMMAIIASLPLASSALSFLVFSAGSEAVKTLNPKSPAAAGVPGDWSWETSQKAM